MAKTMDRRDLQEGLLPHPKLDSLGNPLAREETWLGKRPEAPQGHEIVVTGGWLGVGG